MCRIARDGANSQAHVGVVLDNSKFGVRRPVGLEGRKGL